MNSRTVRYVVLTLLWVSVAAYMLYAGATARRERKARKVARLAIEVVDSTAHGHLVSAAKVRRWIAAEGIKTVGTPVSEVDLTGIEQLIARNGFVDRVAAYLSYEGTLRGLLDHVSVVSGYGWDYDAKAKTVVKDLFDLTREDLSEFDVVIDAFGAWTPETLPLHKTSLAHLCDILSGTNIRLLVVGGAGSLYVDREHTVQVKDLESFPDVFKPLANNMGEALAALRKRSDVQWTYLSPAGDFVADGERTGTYLLGGEEYFVNAKGESRISYADYAIAMIDEIENANNIQKRFSVIGK